MEESYDISWTARAGKDLLQIRKYLVNHASEIVADKVVNALVSVTEILKKQPEMYPPDPNIKQSDRNIRFIRKWNYRIVYEFTGTEVIIARVLHNRRNLQKLMKEDV